MFSQYNALFISEISETVPVAPVVTGITFVFTFHIPCIYIEMFQNFFFSFLDHIFISWNCNIY